MNLEQLTPPAIQPLSLKEVKNHLRILGDDHDDEIISLIEEVTSLLDGRGGELGRCLITQRWKWTFDAPGAGKGQIEIPLPPLQAVESIRWRRVDTEVGALWDDVDVASNVDVLYGHYVGRMEPLPHYVWPWAPGERVELVFRAGFGDSSTDVPAVLRRAMKFILAHWFEHPSAVEVCDMREVPISAQRILDRWRIWEFVSG